MHRLKIAHIPAVLVLPARAPRGLAVHLGTFGQVKEQTQPVLDLLAAQGLVALSLDPWDLGERGPGDGEHPFHRIFSNFRMNMWPILGQTTLDVSRVIDWGLARFNLKSPVLLTGVSMGGDIAIAVAGNDARVGAVVAAGSTPDWLRPGMADDQDPPTLMPPGEADVYARFFYDNFNPMTHVGRYLRDVRLHLVCGEGDTHIRPEPALRFKALVAQADPDAGARVTVEVLAGVRHKGITALDNWWPAAERLAEEMFAARVGRA